MQIKGFCFAKNAGLMQQNRQSPKQSIEKVLLGNSGDNFQQLEKLISSKKGERICVEIACSEKNKN